MVRKNQLEWNHRVIRLRLHQPYLSVSRKVQPGHSTDFQSCKSTILQRSAWEIWLSTYQMEVTFRNYAVKASPNHTGVHWTALLPFLATEDVFYMNRTARGCNNIGKGTNGRRKKHYFYYFSGSCLGPKLSAVKKMCGSDRASPDGSPS